jgi:hypothetical protein
MTASTVRSIVHLHAENLLLLAALALQLAGLAVHSQENSFWSWGPSYQGDSIPISVGVFIAQQTQHAVASAAPLVGEQATAEFCQVPLVALDALAHFLCPLLTFFEIRF